MRHKRGFILFSIVLISCISILLVMPLISWSINEYSWTVRSFRSLKALNLADAGVELAVWEIIHNAAQFTGWTGGNPKSLNLTSFTDNAGGVIGDIAISLDETSSDNYLITSTGVVPFSSNVTVGKTVKVKVFPRALFSNGIFGYDSVTASGNGLVDSYDSSQGPYSPSTAGSNGDIGTNGTLTVSGNAVLNSDVFIGPNGSISGNLSAHVTGQTYYSGNEVELELVSVPGYLSSLTDLGNLQVSGNNSLTILTGDYHYRDISVSGNATLTINANTNIYVEEDFSISGNGKVFTNENVKIYIGEDGQFSGNGIMNVSGIPSDLQIYGVGSTGNFSFSGNNDFSGTLHAPESPVTITGNAEFCGAVVGSDVVFTGNGAFHYDENLGQNGPFLGYNIAYWQED